MHSVQCERRGARVERGGGSEAQPEVVVLDAFSRGVPPGVAGAQHGRRIDDRVGGPRALHGPVEGTRRHGRRPAVQRGAVGRHVHGLRADHVVVVRVAEQERPLRGQFVRAPRVVDVEQRDAVVATPRHERVERVALAFGGVEAPHAHAVVVGGHERRHSGQHVRVYGRRACVAVHADQQFPAWLGLRQHRPQRFRQKLLAVVHRHQHADPAFHAARQTKQRTTERKKGKTTTVYVRVCVFCFKG